MNWLAHLLLSEPTPEFRLGNLLPDLINVSDRSQIPVAFHRGMECHQQIDGFTDTHPVVRRSVARVAKPYRRLAPILMDVFYDHFLSAHWERHSAGSLADFVRDVYRSFDEPCQQLPEPVGQALHRMRTENWLESYRDLAGVRLTLNRMSRRFRRPVDLAEGVGELERNYAALGADFDEFFPELRRHVVANGFNLDSFSSTPACLSPQSQSQS